MIGHSLFLDCGKGGKIRLPTSGFLSNGVEALNGQTGSAWADLSEEARLQALKLVEHSKAPIKLCRFLQQ